MKNHRITTIALALLLSVTASLSACSSDDGAGNDTQSGTDTAGQKIEENLPEDTVTDAPEDTTAPAPAPIVTEPPANEVDDVPTEPGGDDTEDVPDAPSYSEQATEESDYDGAPIIITELAGLAGQTDSGQFVSEQSPNLVLCIDWEYVIGKDGTADVTVTVGISHYRLFAREKFEMGAIQVDGNAVKFSTPKIEYDENTKTFTEFYTATYETTRSEMEVEASWQVLGKYGDIEIDTLTAGGTIVLADNS
ncbi:MAG: hypothetical protein IJW77_00570 [Clostridia bacterium]|nr:hypothetical protein [Clostridia bacterium]